jgi:L-aspartate oxidase
VVAEPDVPAPPGDATRAALWRRAGLCRDDAGLSALLDDPYPLARLVGAAALAREESRGAHQRADHPDTDPSLDLMHTLVAGDTAAGFERWQ